MRTCNVDKSDYPSSGKMRIKENKKRIKRSYVHTAKQIKYQLCLYLSNAIKFV
jgi:hypothetical protein